jgi:CheY-like chemotaxis protein
VIRVLVVDDVPEIRAIHAQFLRGPDMAVTTAEDGDAALRAAREAVPDVVVTDIDMPVMDGLSLCRELRADAMTRRICVIVITGTGELDEAFAAGCDVVLEKPCPRALLLDTVQSFVARRAP